MTEGSPQDTPDESLIQAYRQVLAETTKALLQGRPPRGRKKLLDAVRFFRATGLRGEQVEGLTLLARVESHAGKLDVALQRARAAQRAARAIPDLDAVARIDVLLAELNSRSGRHELALKHGQTAVERIGSTSSSINLASGWEMHAKLALWRFRAGELTGALSAAANASAIAAQAPPKERQQLSLRSDWLWAELLVRAGLPTAAEALAGRALRRADGDGLAGELAFTRGVARLALGATDRATRDFRRVIRLAKESGDIRVEAEALAAQAVSRSYGSATTLSVEDAEAVESEADGKSAADPIAALLARAERRARRSKDLRTLATVASWSGLLQESTTRVEDRETVANSLVALARGSEQEQVVDACMDEVARIAQLPAGAPAYALDPRLLPFRLRE